MSGLAVFFGNVVVMLMEGPTEMCTQCFQFCHVNSDSQDPVVQLFPNRNSNGIFQFAKFKFQTIRIELFIVQVSNLRLAFMAENKGTRLLEGMIFYTSTFLFFI